MADEGITTIKVIPLGGEKVILIVDDNEDFKSLLKDFESFFINNLAVYGNGNQEM